MQADRPEVVYTIAVDMYNGGRIEAPLPPGAGWLHATEGLREVRRRFAGQVLRAQIYEQPNREAGR